MNWGPVHWGWVNKQPLRPLANGMTYSDYIRLDVGQRTRTSHSFGWSQNVGYYAYSGFCISWVAVGMAALVGRAE